MRRLRRTLALLLAAIMLLSMLPVNVFAEDLENTKVQSDQGNAEVRTLNSNIIPPSGTLSLGGYHSAIIKEDGSLWIWGWNGYGQLGNGIWEDHYEPQRIIDNVAQVSLGYDHSAAIKTDGSLWMWGSNGYGQFGNGTTTHSHEPKWLMNDVAQVSLGMYYSAAIKTDGSLWMWGNNVYGQLGDGTTEDRLEPKWIMNDVAQVSLGYFHSAVIKTDGSLWMWGNNWDGQLGDGTLEDRHEPKWLMNDVAQVSLGRWHSAAVKTDGSLWMWGDNWQGLLGDGTTEERHEPKHVMNDITQVSLGQYHSAAIKTDGSLWMWGDNRYGQLGDGTLEDRHEPKWLMNDVAQISLGYQHSATVKTDGSLWMWGNNRNGQLGDGTREFKSSPKKIVVGGKLDSSTPGSGGNTQPGENHYPLEADGEFTFETGRGSGYKTYGYHYDDSWFDTSGYNYQHDLTKMSMKVAMAAFHSDHITDLMDKLGFKYTETRAVDENYLVTNQRPSDSVYYPNRTAPDGSDIYDSIGYAIGHRNTGDKTIIMVAVQGGDYNQDWGGNFRIGAELVQFDHEGFSTAKDQVRQGLEEYIEREKGNFSSNTKIWISGFSRAAATANLLAADLDVNGLKNLEFTPDDLFAFCFECPRNTITTVASNIPVDRPGVYDSVYNNIVSIVNPTDFVTKLVMANFNFSRYGKTYYLPSYQTSKDYSKLRKEMLEKYGDIVDEWFPDKLPEMQGSKKQAEEVETFVNDFGEMAGVLPALTSGRTITPRQYFHNNLESGLIKYAAKGLGHGTTGPSEEESSLILQTALAAIGLHPVNNVGVVAGLWTSPKEFGTDLIASKITSKLAYRYISYLSQTEILPEINAKQDGPIGGAHYPELCLAWLESLENLSEKDWRDYRKVYINCPVDVEVYNKEGEIQAKITEDVPSESETVQADLDDNGQKVLYLPSDQEYTVKLIPSDSGKMTYTVTDYSLDSSSTVEVVSYENLELRKGEAYVSEIPAKDNGYEVILKDPEGEVLTPDVNERDGQISTYLLTVQKEGEGTVTGGGSFTKGQFARINAEPAEGFRFDGWYDGQTLVSSEPSYRFAVPEDMTLKALFTKKDTEENRDPVEPVNIKLMVQGSGSVTGDGKYEKGATVKLTATPGTGYHFVSWTTRDGKEISRDNPYYLTADSDLEITALFEKDKTDGENNGNNQENQNPDKDPENSQNSGQDPDKKPESGEQKPEDVNNSENQNNSQDSNKDENQEKPGNNDSTQSGDNNENPGSLDENGNDSNASSGNNNSGQDTYGPDSPSDKDGNSILATDSNTSTDNNNSSTESKTEGTATGSTSSTQTGTITSGTSVSGNNISAPTGTTSSTTTGTTGTGKTATVSESPKTGDSSAVMGWLMVTALGALSAAGVIVYKKKR